MSVQNPYSDVKIPGKSYFANEAFEPDQSSRPAGEVKERFPGQFPQADGAPARRQPASVANPYGSIYRSSPGGDSKQAGLPEGEEGGGPCPCPCPRWCKCCSCCRCCVIS